VDIAFVQGGIGDPFGAPDLMSLASIFLEPLWVFVRADSIPRRLTELKGKRIAIGVPGSGTRVLPFWAAVLAERLLIMLVPLITIMIPLFKIAPPAYRWGVRRKIYRWYKELRDLESRVATARDEADPAQIAAELDRIQAQVGRLKVPLSYAEQLYDLRLHIGFVKNLLHDMPKAAQPHPG